MSDRTYGLIQQALLVALDVFAILAGVWTMLATPPSFVASGAASFATTFWSSALILGGIVSTGSRLAGLANWEIMACTVVAVGFAVWGLSATFQPNATYVSYGVACGFGRAAVHAFVRALYVARGVLDDRSL